MDRELQGKVAVVTGGAEGIGYHISDNFLTNGAKTVILLDINETLGTEAAEKLNKKHGEGKAFFLKCDVTKDLEAVSSDIFKKFEVDILVNNAGICDEQSVRKTIDINLISLLEWSIKFWEYMRKDTGGRGGTIFNVSSIYGVDFDPWLPIYKTSKHGVIGFTKTLGHPYNYEKFGVRVIAICPGFTKTALGGKIIPWECHKDGFKEFSNTNIFQSVELVGKAAVEIFIAADSGTSWEARDNKPIRQVPIHNTV